MGDMILEVGLNTTPAKLYIDQLKKHIRATMADAFNVGQAGRNATFGPSGGKDAERLRRSLEALNGIKLDRLVSQVNAAAKALERMNALAGAARAISPRVPGSPRPATPANGPPGRNPVSELAAIARAENRGLSMDLRSQRQTPTMRDSIVGTYQKELEAYTKAVQQHGLKSLTTAAAYGELQKAFTRGNHAIADANGLLRNLDRNFASLRGSMGGIGAGLTQISTSILTVGKHTNGVRGSISQFNQGITQVNGGLSGLTSGLAAAAAGYIAFNSAVSGFRSLLEKNLNLDKLNNQLMSLAGGDTKKAASELDYLKSTADKLGVAVSSVGTNYVRFSMGAKEAGLSAADTRKVFENLGGASTALGLSADETARVFKAMEQSSSKLAFQAEETKSQLGDAGLVGVMSALRKATGLTGKELEKAMQQGMVSFKDYAVPFSKALLDQAGGLDAVKRGANGLQASLNRLSDAYTFAAGEAGASGFNDAVKESAGTLAAFLKSADGIEMFRKLGEATKLAADAAIWLGKNIEGVGYTLAALAGVRVIGWLGSIASAMGTVATAARVMWMAISGPVGIAAAVGTAILTIIKYLQDYNKAADSTQTAAQKFTDSVAAAVKAKDAASIDNLIADNFDRLSKAQEKYDESIQRAMGKGASFEEAQKQFAPLRQTLDDLQSRIDKAITARNDLLKPAPSETPGQGQPPPKLDLGGKGKKGKDAAEFIAELRLQQTELQRTNAALLSTETATQRAAEANAAAAAVAKLSKEATAGQRSEVEKLASENVRLERQSKLLADGQELLKQARVTGLTEIQAATATYDKLVSDLTESLKGQAEAEDYLNRVQTARNKVLSDLSERSREQQQLTLLGLRSNILGLEEDAAGQAKLDRLAREIELRRTLKDVVKDGTISQSEADSLVNRTLDLEDAKRGASEFQRIFSGATSAIYSAFENLGNGISGFLVGLKNIARSVANDIIKEFIRVNIVKKAVAWGSNLMGFTATPSAKGNVFSGGVVEKFMHGGMFPAQKFARGGAFTNGIVNSPTYFNVGQMGEGGQPEAIVPLVRTANGDLGIQAEGMGGGMAVNVGGIHVNVQGGSSGNGAADAQFAQTIAEQMRMAFQGEIAEFMRKQARPGGMLNPTF